MQDAGIRNDQDHTVKLVSAILWARLITIVPAIRVQKIHMHCQSYMSKAKAWGLDQDQDTQHVQPGNTSSAQELELLLHA